MPSEIQVIYSDADILIVDKPSGLLSIPDGYNPSLPHVRSVLEPEFGRLFIVHRLDKETSGLLILARSKASHKNINDQFANRIVKKEYHAIVYCPSPFPKKFSITSPLRLNADRQHRTRVDHTMGKPAQTDFTLIRSMNDLAYVAAHPLSGYTHQIRAHLFSMGFQILGDALYSLHDEKYDLLLHSLKITNMFLHSYQISLLHPATGKPVTFTASLPNYFNEILSKAQ